MRAMLRLLALAALVAAVRCAATDFGVVCEERGGEEPACELQAGHVDDGLGAASWGSFVDTIEQDGWSRLHVHTSGKYGEELQAFAAGYLEGALTTVRTRQHYNNFLAATFPAGIPPALLEFVQRNDEWVRRQIRERAHANARGADGTYWHRIGLLYRQLDGVAAGFNAHSESGPLSKLDVLLLNMQGDAGELVQRFGPGFANLTRSGAGLSLQHALDVEREASHCSVLIKVLWRGEGTAQQDGPRVVDDVVAAHTMWWGYYSMLRVFKHYHFAGRATVAVSSYPATLSSTDDYYQTSHGLLVTETTNAVYAQRLLERLRPEGTVWTWARVMAANYWAASGAEWVSVFSPHNSGTYNNQWMVLDMKRVRPGSVVEDGALTVLEQLPGFIRCNDQSEMLRFHGHWASYNRAFYRDVFAMSGALAQELDHGDTFSYERNPRALIFRRDQSAVNSTEALMRFIRSNDWQHDPLSQGSAANQIAARYDLIDTQATGAKRRPNGATDAKVTNAALFSQGACLAVSGPTHDQQPVFRWSTAAPEVAAAPHEGHPDAFGFDWVTMRPRAAWSAAATTKEAERQQARAARLGGWRAAEPEAIPL